jgi:hypothetical protein
MDDDVVHYSIG